MSLKKAAPIILGFFSSVAPIAGVNLAFAQDQEESMQPMDEESVATRILRIISEKLAIDAAEIMYEHSFTDDLGADSIDVVELIMEVEHEFGIEITDEIAAQLSTVGQAIQFVENQVGS